MRVCYILGNLTARTDDARQRLFDTYRAFETLLNILKTALNSDLKVKVSVTVKVSIKNGCDWCWVCC